MGLLQQNDLIGKTNGKIGGLMSLPSLSSQEWSKEDVVLVRVDFNVPLNDEGEISDDTRVRAALPTLQYLLERECTLVVCSHLGRPKGTPNPAYTLKPVAEHLRTLLGQEVIFVDQTVGSAPKAALENRGSTQIILLENLRFQKGEKSNNSAFAKDLAHLANAYVNDAFGVLHRAHASVSAAAKLFKKKAVGFLIEKEYAALSKIYDEKPMMAVLGGAKVSDKILLMESLIEQCNDIFIGGAMAYTFLRAKGIAVGTSRIEKDRIGLATDLLRLADLKNVNIHLPVDHITIETFDEAAPTEIEAVISENRMGVDIGPQTIEKYSLILKEAKSIFWNGPMGVFEWESCVTGTKSIAQTLCAIDGYTVVGGGDSAAAVQIFELADKIDHVSTGGGASLAFLEGEPLPGLKSFTEAS